MTRLGGAWSRFWFEPVSSAPLALFRIAYGLLVCVWALVLLPDAQTFAGPSGIIPEQPAADGAWGLLRWVNEDWAATGLVALLALSALALALGWHARIAAALVFVCLVSISQRAPYIGNAGDALLRALAFYLLLAPSGRALSLDRWRTDRERFWEAPPHRPVALRLIQIQVSLLYLSTFWAKMRGETWPAGDALAYALRLEDLERYPLPDLGASDLLVGLMTWGVLAAELALGTLVWNRRLRPFVLLLGVALHLGIQYGLRVGFFSLVIITAYLAWVPPDAADRAVARARIRLIPSGGWPREKGSIRS